MKTLFLASLLALACSMAQAGTMTLPEPSLAQITGISNLGAETPNDIATTRGHQAITGWSADGTTWAGEAHTFECMETYRRQTGIRAKLAVVAFTATSRTIRDVKDPGSMDFVGMDASLPTALSYFVQE